jgi:biopolymer transport protein ExbB/TolQ
MEWLLLNSPWIIGLVGVIHFAAFMALWLNRNKQTRRLEAHLRNIVGHFSTRSDVDPDATIDERIDGFIHDIREVLHSPHRRDDQRKLYNRLVVKEESRIYLHGRRFETVLNVLQTFIETYPLWGILGTLLGIGLGFAGRAMGTVTSSSHIVRNFGGAIWCTVAGLTCAIVLMMVHSVMEPGLRRLTEHRAAVRDVIRSARTELGVAMSKEPSPDPASPRDPREVAA